MPLYSVLIGSLCLSYTISKTVSWKILALYTHDALIYSVLLYSILFINSLNSCYLAFYQINCKYVSLFINVLEPSCENYRSWVAYVCTGLQSKMYFLLWVAVKKRVENYFFCLHPSEVGALSLFQMVKLPGGVLRQRGRKHLKVGQLVLMQ